MQTVYINAFKNNSGNLEVIVDEFDSIECTYNKKHAIKKFENVIALEDFDVKNRALRYHTHRGL